MGDSNILQHREVYFYMVPNIEQHTLSLDMCCSIVGNRPVPIDPCYYYARLLYKPSVSTTFVVAT